MLEIQSGTLHLWIMKLAATTGTSEFLTALSPDEIERAKRFHSEIHQARFSLIRYKLRWIISQYLNESAKDIHFQYTEKHKPYLASPNPKQLQFNISHSGVYAVYAIALKNEIGIDIEKYKERPFLALVERYFTAEEKNAFQSLPAKKQEQAFYSLWTKKEAILKASGLGLSGLLNTFSVNYDQNDQLITLSDTQYHLIALDLIEDYALALASQDQIKHLYCYEIDAMDSFNLIKMLDF